MGAGKGRNEPCWCGSGLKFKKCHLDREQQQPMPVWEVESVFRDTYHKEECLAPDSWRHECSGRIVRAHTVSKSSSLTRIQRDGHVYAFAPSMKSLTRHGGRLVPELVGINRASTFTGFCSRHDDELFAPFEKVAFLATPQQCFLLGYRALARELFTKERAMELGPLRRSADKGGSAYKQMQVQAFNNAMDIGLEMGLNDMRSQKAEYDRYLIARDFSKVRAYVIETFEVPPVMCSAGWMPQWDFNGSRLQNLSELTHTASMTCTSFWGGAHGAVVFEWLEKDDDVCRQFIASLHTIADAKLGAALTRLMFEHFENLHISPAWWEGLTNSSREALIDRMSMSASVLAARHGKALGEDGVTIPEWRIKRRLAVGWDFDKSSANLPP